MTQKDNFPKAYAKAVQRVHIGALLSTMTVTLCTAVCANDICKQTRTIGYDPMRVNNIRPTHVHMHARHGSSDLLTKHSLPNSLIGQLGLTTSFSCIMPTGIVSSLCC